ncbi:hypothetical protein OPV22_007067 [Ensete ventricosum]|uniref:Uncharacterized protein n=1 Tax=Ensete ventricosum TaxID=4639 RepID=A0AAV8RM49_ENSVE|nr:hypothetical protein OPV22_007067 [Ensete ventricosum]
MLVQFFHGVLRDLRDTAYPFVNHKPFLIRINHAFGHQRSIAAYYAVDHCFRTNSNCIFAGQCKDTIPLLAFAQRNKL